MERVAGRHGALPDPRFPREAGAEPETPRHMPYRTVLGNPMYLRRMLLLVVVWLTGYVTVYGFSAGFTSVLTALGGGIGVLLIAPPSRTCRSSARCC